MLQTNKFKTAVNQGKTAFGLINSIPSPLLVEMIGYAGYDFVILDMEHVSGNPETLENSVRAAECAGITSLVRVPAITEEHILRALDCGALGIVAPHVKSRSDAEALVRAGRYHPHGERGISGGRTTGFGSIDLVSYFEQANREIMLVAMIEDKAGVEAIDEIVTVEGIDMILEGAIDLSQSYGVPGQHQHVTVQAAIQTIAESCLRHNMPFCAIPRTPDQLEKWQQQGVNTFLVGDDRGVAFRAMKRHLDSFCQ